MRVFVDPFSRQYYGNGLFDPTSKLNRDDCLRPWLLLRRRLGEQGLRIDTADYLLKANERGAVNVYVSLGMRDNYRALATESDVLLNAFYLFEVIAVDPAMYREIPELARHFRAVYSWSDAESLGRFVPGPLRLRHFHWPMPFESVLEPHWSNTQRSGTVMISGNKRAALPDGELYTERLRALRSLWELGAQIDLWGHLWERGLGELEPEFGDVVRATYRGTTPDKYETLSRYRFAICYENMILKGWLTEKIFDCFYAGTVPVYLGTPDIADRVARDCFIDRREFGDDEEVHRFLEQMTPSEWGRYREAARDFLGSDGFRPFTAEAFAERFISDIRDHLAEVGIGQRAS